MTNSTVWWSFVKISLKLWPVGDKQTNRQTNRQTDVLTECLSLLSSPVARVIKGLYYFAPPSCGCKGHLLTITNAHWTKDVRDSPHRKEKQNWRSSTLNSRLDNFSFHLKNQIKLWSKSFGWGRFASRGCEINLRFHGQSYDNYEIVCVCVFKHDLNLRFRVSNGRLKVPGEPNRVSVNTARAQNVSFTSHTSFWKSRILSLLTTWSLGSNFICY